MIHKLIISIVSLVISNGLFYDENTPPPLFAEECSVEGKLYHCLSNERSGGAVMQFKATYYSTMHSEKLSGKYLKMVDVYIYCKSMYHQVIHLPLLMLRDTSNILSRFQIAEDII